MSVRLVASTSPYGTPSPLSPLIGRQDEIASLLALLAGQDVRLLTLTGPGGIGKTRLALRVAADSSDDFGGGVLFVSLASIQDPALVIPAIARAAGLAESTTKAGLIEHLGDREQLLLLDNFEQIVDAAPLLAQVLEQCPRIKALVTSRMPLQLQGEQRFPVAPLSLPSNPKATLADLNRSDAVALFLQRARAIRPNLSITERDAPVVAEICRRLDGIPLALELAAARTNVLSLPALLARLTDRLQLLASDRSDRPERLRTMRLAIAWSYELLSPDEQSVFRHAAVFSGGAGLEALETVANRAALSTFEFLDCVGRLVDHSLMERKDAPNGESRIAMLETLREFGIEQMRALDEESALRDAHAAYFLAFVENGEPRLIGAGQSAWFEQLELEQDNLRAALDWAMRGGDVESVLRFCAAVWRFWSARGRMAEGRDWVERALASSESVPGPVLLRALIAAAFLAHDCKDFNAAAARFSEAIVLAESTGEQIALAQALDGLGTVTHAQGDFAGAAVHHVRSAEIFEAAGDRRGLSVATANLGTIDYHMGNFASAERRMEVCRRIVHELGDVQGEMLMVSNLGALAVMQSDYERAEVLLNDAVAMLRQLGIPLSLADNLTNLGDIRQFTGDLDAAMVRYDEAAEILRNVEDPHRLAVLEIRIAKIAFARGEIARSRELVAGSVRALVRVGDQFALVEAIEELALMLVHDPDARMAARIYGAVASIRDAISSPRREPDIPAYEAAMARLRDAMGVAGLEDAIAFGKRMTPEDLVAFIAALPRPASNEPNAPVKPIAPVQAARARLSDRERDVLRLVAAGYSSREVADALFISPRTATTHVEHILTKLGVNSRSAAVAVAMREGLV